jgi:serine/arginine repetitive matrix protein 2
MYGNVGLPTARGSGTNGYIQRNLSFIKKKYKLGNYKEIINQFQLNPLQSKKRIDNEIIEHEIKYKIEIELYDLKEKLKNDGENEIEIENKIKLKREELKNKLLKNNNEFMDKKETHSTNKLKTSKMDILKNALKIKEEYKIGEAFDAELQENKKKKMKKKNY